MTEWTEDELKTKIARASSDFDSQGMLQNDEVDAGELSVTILVPEPCVAWLIGKQGATVNQLKALSMCNISFAKKETSARGTRKVAVSGSLGNCAKAIGIICLLIQAAQSSCSMGILVNSNVAGAVIGKGGENLKRIREITGCRVGMEKSEDSNPTFGGRCLTLSHPESALSSAQAAYDVLRTPGFSSPSIRAGGTASVPMADPYAAQLAQLSSLGYGGAEMTPEALQMLGMGYGAVPAAGRATQRFNPYSAGRNDPNICITHGKKRGKQNLQPSMTIAGAYECMEHDPCKVGAGGAGGSMLDMMGLLGMAGMAGMGAQAVGTVCATHGKKRGARNLQPHPSIPGQFICLDSDRCK